MSQQGEHEQNIFLETHLFQNPQDRLKATCYQFSIPFQNVTGSGYGSGGRFTPEDEDQDQHVVSI